jgi:hypothetical protein
MATNRQRAEKQHLTTRDYFWYATKPYSWVDKKKFNFELREVMCTECNYIPRGDSTDPKRAYKAHVKKNHPVKYWSEIAKPFVIKEEREIEITDWRKELLGV